MRIRCASDVIAIAKARGFRIIVDPGPPPMPKLTFRVRPEQREAQVAEASQALMGALKTWRIEIMKLVTEGKA